MINNKSELKEVIVRSNAKFRYLEFLKEFYSLAKENKEISFIYLSDKHKIAKGLQLALVELKIAKKISVRNYKWIGNKPSLEMANLILKWQRERYVRVKIEPTIKNKAITNNISYKPRVKSIQEPKEKNTISILWGLIKITRYVN